MDNPTNLHRVVRGHALGWHAAGPEGIDYAIAGGWVPHGLCAETEVHGASGSTRIPNGTRMATPCALPANGPYSCRMWARA